LRDVVLAYINWLLTASVALTIVSLIALMLRRRLLASLGFLALGFGAAAIVWDEWSRRAGHHMELTALLHPVALSSREAFLLATHGPLFLIGVGLLLAASARTKSPELDPP
jgi:hypothetical protein